jgi:CBS-domain-containing membrane protein
VREVMSQDVRYVYGDESVEDVARNMSELQVRRLPVVNRDKRLVGIVSLCDCDWRSTIPSRPRRADSISQPDH